MIDDQGRAGSGEEVGRKRRAIFGKEASPPLIGARERRGRKKKIVGDIINAKAAARPLATSPGKQLDACNL